MKQPDHAMGDNLPLAIGAILFAVFALSAGDALVKRFSVDLSLWQIFVLRSAVAAPVLLTALRLGFRAVSLRPRHPGWTALRSLLLAFNWVAYYLALTELEISVAAAAYYTSPLMIALFAALFLGERVGARGWMAIVVGFIGVSLVLRPRAEDFSLYALLPLAAAALYALAMILTRSKCRGEHPLILSLGLVAAFLAVGGAASAAIAVWAPDAAQVEANAFLLGGWAAMDADAWIVMLVMGAAVIVGGIGAAIAYQAGPASVIAGFDFAYVGFAAAWGILFFAEAPDAPTLFGMALIVGGGMLAARR